MTFQATNLFACSHCFCWLAAILLITSGPLEAQTIDWTNTSGTPAPYYQVGENWAGQTPPNSNQMARFDEPATYQVWWDANTTNITPAVGFINQLQGSVTWLNVGGNVQHLLTINGSDNGGQFSDFSISGGGTSITSRGLFLDSLGGGEIQAGATLNLDGSHSFGSRLRINGEIGFDVSGNLNIDAGALLESNQGFVGRLSDSTGVVTVTGSGSHWANAGDLSIGGTATESGGAGTLNITDGGLVTVGGTTNVWVVDTGVGVVLDGGRFAFGTTTLAEFETIHAISGSMAGDVVHTGYTDVASLTALRNPSVDLSEVRVANAGVLYGNAILETSLINQITGQLMTAAGESMRFSGGSSINAGEINNFGGQVRFVEALTNESSGLIGGRGQFFAEGGWTNDGVIAMSGGFADVHGDLVNGAEGIIAIGGGSTTTFYDDVTMDAENMNMEIASDSYAVLLGSYNGGSNGLGTVQAFGDLRPGNSPASVSFGRNLELGSNTVTHIELGGDLVDEFDQLLIGGDFLIDGNLEVALTDGFEWDYDQLFVIADVGGNVTGTFTGLDEGAIVDQLNGIDLRITYLAGDGNDIALFTDPAPISPTLPLGRKFLDGFGVSGNLGSIHASDDQYWEIDPSPTSNPAKQKVDLVLVGTSPTTSPTTFSFRLESRMTGGNSGPVIQQIYFVRTSDNRKELIDSRPVTNVDETIVVTPSGDINRFVNPANGDVIVKITYITDPSGPLFTWNVELDEAVWLID